MRRLGQPLRKRQWTSGRVARFPGSLVNSECSTKAKGALERSSTRKITIRTSQVRLRCSAMSKSQKNTSARHHIQERTQLEAELEKRFRMLVGRRTHSLNALRRFAVQ